MAGPGGLRYSCPLEKCRWYYDEAADQMFHNAPGYDNSDPNIIRLPSLAGVRDKTERELQRHLDTHTKRDFLETIALLRAQLVRGSNLLTP